MGSHALRVRDLCRFVVWIVLLSLLSVALSAWVRWRLAASALLVRDFLHIKSRSGDGE